jgi:hypothetical protein
LLFNWTEAKKSNTIVTIFLFLFFVFCFLFFVFCFLVRHDNQKKRANQTDCILHRQLTVRISVLCFPASADTSTNIYNYPESFIMRYPFQALYAIFLSALTLLLITSPSMAAPMLVTGSPEGPPISWKKHDALAGVGPTLATKILTELNVEFTISPQGSWQEVQDKAKEGTVDMLVSAYENNERRTYMDYSVPYLKSPVVIVVKKEINFLSLPGNHWLEKREWPIRAKVLAKNWMPLLSQICRFPMCHINEPLRCWLKMLPIT